MIKMNDINWSAALEEYYEEALMRLEAENAALRGENQALAASLNGVLGSRVWKLTAPLRKLMGRSKAAHQAPEDVPAPALPELKTPPELPEGGLTVSFIIPALNGGEDLRALLGCLNEQEGLDSFEILVVDSGSSDGSDTLAAEMGARVIAILPEEFTHSYARNLGAEQATGNYLIFLTQDALPLGRDWARKLLEPLLARRAVAASGVQVPRPGAGLYARLGVYVHRRYMGLVDANTGEEKLMRMPEDPTVDSLKQNANLDNVNCAIRRDIFEQYRFRGTIMEDLDMGLRLIQDGWPLALLKNAQVRHSHDRSLWYTLKRSYADNMQMAKMLPESVGKHFPKEYLPAACVNGWRQMRRLAQQASVLPLDGKPLELRKRQLLRYLDSLKAETLAEGFEPMGEAPFDTLIEALFAIYEHGPRREDSLREGWDEFIGDVLFPFLKAEAPLTREERDQGLADCFYKCYASAVGTLLAKYALVHPGEDAINRLAQGLEKGV